METPLGHERTPRSNRSESDDTWLPLQPMNCPPTSSDPPPLSVQPPTEPRSAIGTHAEHSPQSSRKRPRPARHTSFTSALSSNTISSPSASETQSTSDSIRTGSIPASFTPSAKATIRKAAQPHSGTCFICSSPHTEVAHLIAKSSPSTHLRDLRSRGLLPISALGDPRNGILLCPNCHGALDRSPRPDVILLPKYLEWFVEFEGRDFAYRTQVWTAEKRAVPRTVPSGEEYRLRCQAISGRAGSGIRCDYGGLYNAYYIRDYHATDPHLRPSASVGAVQLHAGTGKTAKGWVPKQWHGAPVLCIISAGRAIGDLAAMKGVFVVLTELMKLWSREPWTENEDGDGDDSDRNQQDNSPVETDRTGGGGNIPPSPSYPPPANESRNDSGKSHQAHDSNPGGTRRPHSSRHSIGATHTIPPKEHHSPHSTRTKHTYTMTSIPTPPHSFACNIQDVEGRVVEEENMWPQVYHFGPSSTSEDKVRWVRNVLRIYD